MPPKAATHKVGDYALVPKFLGYHAREEPSKLPIGTMIAPSQNVLIETTGRVKLASGYVLDGAGSSTPDSGILSNYDFTPTVGATRNMRAGFLTAAGNDGKLQYRYLDATGAVNWVNLRTALTNVRLSYTSYWDNTNFLNQLTWVDGSNNIFQWNGAVTTFASGTPNTVISFAGNSVSLTGASAVTGTAAFITGSNGSVGSTYLGYAGLTANPTNGLTLILTLNATAITITFVTAIGSTPGNVLIGGSLATTMTNLLGLLNAPGTTNANQVALSGPNQTLVGYITYASNSNTITNQGTQTWAQMGFTGTGSIVIAGVAYTYAGGNYSQTLFGISSDVSATTVAAIVHQAPITTTLASMSGIPATFAPTIVGCGRINQLYVGALTSNVIYISKVNIFTDYTFTAAGRIAGEGWSQVLDSPATAFVPMEDRTDASKSYDLYISSGKNTWGLITSTISVTFDTTGALKTTIETIQYLKLRATALEGALSERFAVLMKNHIAFIGHDHVANFFGWISFENVPETVDFSYPIIDDMNSYDFTDGSIFYYKNYIYITIPKAGIIRIYNMTDQTKQTTMSTYHPYEDVDVANQPWFWEAPITYPVSGFYVTDDLGLCAHSYTTSESYQIFTGGSLKGQNIIGNATFSLDDKGDRTSPKASDTIFVDGYIAQNTDLPVTITGDLDTFATSQTVTVNGDDNTIVAYGSGAHALGKNPLGSQPLGGANLNTATRPAWFHVALTYPEVPCYLEQISFETNGVDLAWEITTFGTNAKFTSEGISDITQ